MAESPRVAHQSETFHSKGPFHGRHHRGAQEHQLPDRRLLHTTINDLKLPCQHARAAVAAILRPHC
jgi:hypothetical protein